MKKIIIFIYLSFFIVKSDFCYPQNNQNELDSLYKLLEGANEDTAKASLFEKLSTHYINTAVSGNLDSTFSYAKRAILLSEKIDWKLGMGRSYSVLAQFYSATGVYDSVLFYNRKALDVFKKEGRVLQIANTNSRIGLGYMEMGEYPKAIGYFELSLNQFLKHRNLKGIANQYGNLALTYENMGENILSMENYRKGVSYAIKSGDKSKISRFYSHIGNLNYIIGNYEVASENYLKALKIFETLKDQRGVASELNNLGTLYWRQKDYDKALEYYEKSLVIEEELGNDRGKIPSYINIATIHTDKKDFLKSLEYLQKAYLLNKTNKHYSKDYYQSMIHLTFGSNFQSIGLIDSTLSHLVKTMKFARKSRSMEVVASVLINYCGAFIEKGKPEEAKLYADSALWYAIKYKMKEIEKYSYKAFVEIDSANGNWGSAFKNYKIFISKRDSLVNQENLNEISQKQMLYEFDKKEIAMIAEQSKKDAIAKEEKEKQRIILYSTGGGLAMVLAFLFFLFKRFQVTKRQKSIIEKQKHLVEEKHKEITDSINYAERIQRSFMATRELLDANLAVTSSTSASPVISSEVEKGTGLDASTVLDFARPDIDFARTDTDFARTGNYFVLFKPKDVVSGDFYWASTLSNGNFLLATADSTGHGVPGAIMSILNISSLEKAVEQGLTNPAEILNHTRKTIIERLKKDGSKEGGKDGMDCALCVFDFNAKKLLVAAANNPVWVVRNNRSLSLSKRPVIVGNDAASMSSVFDLETGASRILRQGSVTTSASELPQYSVIEIKPDKMPVGKHDKQENSFTLHEVDLQKDDVVYALTDGFPDQFGGEKGKKFMIKNLRELIQQNAHLTMEEQKTLLEKTFSDWVGNLEQIDDVCIIGVRV